METHVSSGNSDGEHRQAQEKLSNTETSVQIREIATNQLLSEIRTLIESSRKQAAQAVNTALVLLYWRIGRRIHIEILGEGRAEYGERVVETLSKSLAQEYGKGFSRRNLFRMIRFAEIFPDEQIVSTLSAQLSWSHFLEIFLCVTYYSVTSMLKCAVSNAGVCKPYEPKFAVCSTNALLSHASQNN